LSAVVARIGQPLGERSVAGKRVYYWGSPELSSKSDRGKQCQIQATMNGDVIERLAYEGDEALCQKYAERLRSQRPFQFKCPKTNPHWEKRNVDAFDGKL
jgi:hypothetical protein